MFGRVALSASGAAGPSNPWDISTAVYVRSSGILGNTIRAVFMKPDGTTMYVVDSTSSFVRQYLLTTPWNISSYSIQSTFYTTGYDADPSSVFFSQDGSRMFVLGYSTDKVYYHPLSTAWDISSASSTPSQSFSVSSQEAIPSGIFFKPDGTEMYMTGPVSDNVNQYGLSTAWDLSTASFSQSFSVASQEGSSNGVFFKPDGTSMYIIGSVADKVHQYSLSTAWDISTSSFVQDFSVSAQDGTPTSVFFSPDGTRMYTSGAANDRVYQYSVG